MKAICEHFMLLDVLVHRPGSILFTSGEEPPLFLEQSETDMPVKVPLHDDGE
jgi:hypothetical protein